jgi:hypothetical protein
VVGGSFVDAMVCLEALLNEEPNNIKFKLSMRRAFILGLMDLILVTRSAG